MSAKTALVLLAEGAEEMETVIAVDVLRRGGVTVTLAGLDSTSTSAGVVCSRNIKIVADATIDSLVEAGTQFDAVILPGGGKGAENLANSPTVGKLLQAQESSGRIIGAICAAPTALLKHNIGKGKKVTSYPAFKEKLEKDFTYSEDPVVVDGSLVTSRGPGTSFAFAIKLVELLAGEGPAAPLAKQMILE